MGDDHIEHKMLSRGIENAQKRIESKNLMLGKACLSTMMFQMIKDKQFTL